MSLFKSRELWGAHCGVNESFEPYSLCVCGGDTGHDQENQIILTGSLDGFLRVYQPELMSDDHTSDLLLETQLAAPILALHTGKFANTSGIQFAVLTSSKLIVVKITIPESVEYVSQYSLSLLYEHDLPLHPFSLTVGPFGLKDNNDYLCIQSLNGVLSFYEQERVGITCKLPLLLPSPLCYVISTDSFLICDSSWVLQSYRYQSMANSTVELHVNAESKSILSEWQFNLNEALVDLQAIKNNQLSYILALGEKTMYCIKDTGVPLWCKKLNYHPMSLALQIPADNPENLIVMVCTEAGTLLIHKHDSLQWNCKLPSAAIGLKVGRFKGTDGFLVALSETGQLNILYLGTQPVEYGFTIAHRPVNDQECLKEIAVLKQQLLMNSVGMTTASEDVKIDLNFSTCLERDYFESENGEVDVLSGSVNILLAKSSPENELHVTFNPSCELITAFPPWMRYQYTEKAAQSVAVQFYIPTKYRKLLIHSCNVEVTVIVSSSAQSGRTSLRKVFALPLQLVMRESQPLREAQVKVTVSSNQPTANLTQLFPDMNCDPSMTNAIALEHLNGSNVTILASRQTNKYRLQSESLSAMALPLSALVQRLCTHLMDLRLSLDSSLPTHELWNQVEIHHSAHKQWLESANRVNKATFQLQMIQRDFHSKVLNTLSADLTDALTLVQIAHDQIMEAINCQESLHQELVIASNNLENALSCILSLVALTEHGRQDHRRKLIEMLRQTLLPVENAHCQEQSWEKTAEIQLSLLIQRWTNSNQRLEGNPDVKISEHSEVDMAKLKKRLLQTLDIIVSQSGMLEVSFDN